MKKIISLSESNERRGVKAFMYGLSGVGKTYTIPSLGEGVLVASAEKGLRTIDGAEGIDVIEVDELRDLVDAYSYSKDYRWLVVDSLTEIAKKILANYKPGAADVRQAYGQVMDDIENTTRAMQCLPVNVLCLAHEVETVDKETKRHTIGPLLAGQKLTAAIPHVFDEVWRLHCVGDRRMIRTKRDGVIIAKSRGHLDPVMDVTDNGLAEVLERLNA